MNTFFQHMFIILKELQFTWSLQLFSVILCDRLLALLFLVTQNSGTNNNLVCGIYSCLTNSEYCFPFRGANSL